MVTIVKSLLKLDAFGEKLQKINDCMREVQEVGQVISAQGEFLVKGQNTYRV